MKVKSVLSKRGVLLTLAVLTVIIGALSYLAWSSPTEVKYRSLTCVHRDVGVLKHEAYLKSNDLYGGNMTAEYYPKKLVKNIKVTYCFSSDRKNGSFEFEGKILYSVGVRNGRYILWEDRLFDRRGVLKNGSFNQTELLNLSEIDSRISSVVKELRVRRLDTDILLMSKVISQNSTFTHTIKLVRDPLGLIYFDNVRKERDYPVYADKNVKNRLKPLGLDVGLARIVFTCLLALILPPLTYSAYLQRDIPRTSGLDRIAVKGELNSRDRRYIMLETENDIKKVYELLDKPIIKRGDEYLIADENTVYVYKPRKGN